MLALLLLTCIFTVDDDGGGFARSDGVNFERVFPINNSIRPYCYCKPEFAGVSEDFVFFPTQIPPEASDVTLHALFSHIK